MINASSGKFDYCSSQAFEDPYGCSNFIDSNLLESEIATECQGKTRCKLTDLARYVKEDSPGFNRDECRGRESVIFVQMACMIPADTLSGRKMAGLAAGCMAVFTSLFVISYFDYVKNVQKNMYIEWDVKTVTAGDYTVEVDIPEDMFEKWNDTQYLSYF